MNITPVRIKIAETAQRAVCRRVATLALKRQAEKNNIKGDLKHEKGNKRI